jgi:hypothetical protein
MVDKWLVFVLSEFISAAIAFFFAFVMRSVFFIWIGGFFFSFGVFALTRWGFDRWKNKQKAKKKRG